MSLSRREFLQALAAAAAAGLPLDSRAASGDAAFYDFPRLGSLSLLHFTDCHAQLLPVYFREPSANIGVARSNRTARRTSWRALLKMFRAAGARGSVRILPLDLRRRAPLRQARAVSPTSPRW